MRIIYRRSEVRQIIDRVLDGLHNDDDAWPGSTRFFAPNTAVSRYCMSYVELHGHLAWRSGPTTLDADALTAEPCVKRARGQPLLPVQSSMIDCRQTRRPSRPSGPYPLFLIPHSSFRLTRLRRGVSLVSPFFGDWCADRLGMGHVPFAGGCSACPAAGRPPCRPGRRRQADAGG